MNSSTTEFSAAQYESLVPPGFEDFYWHRARNSIVTRKLRARLSTSDLLLDVGCGAGILVAHLRREGFLCDGADLGRPERVVSGAEGHLHLGQDAFTLAKDYRERVSAVLLLDVIEHLPDPRPFLLGCEEAFPNASLVFMTVPARMEIWSNFDDFNRHYRRYTIESIRELEVPPSFVLDEVGYFFHSLYWAARAQGLLANVRTTTMKTPRPVWLHALVGRVLELEERLLPVMSRGSSIYAAYRRTLR